MIAETLKRVYPGVEVRGEESSKDLKGVEIGEVEVD